jgi:hypothetical protein
MKKTIYYSELSPNDELEVFINNKNEITFSIEGYGEQITISLAKVDVEELIVDLQKMLEQI